MTRTYAVTVKDEIVSIEGTNAAQFADHLSRVVTEDRLAVAPDEVQIDVVGLSASDHATMVYEAIGSVKEIAGESPELNLVGPTEAPPA